MNRLADAQTVRAPTFDRFKVMCEGIHTYRFKVMCEEIHTHRFKAMSEGIHIYRFINNMQMHQHICRRNDEIPQYSYNQTNGKRRISDFLSSMEI